MAMGVVAAPNGGGTKVVSGRYEVGQRPAGRFTALIFSDPGTGKTHLISTTPVDTLVVSCDISGAETLEKGELVAAKDARGVHIWVEEAHSDTEAFKILVKAKNEVENAIRKGEPLPFQMVVLDGLCALEDGIQSDLVAQGGPYVQNNRPEMLSQGGWGALGARHLRVRRAALSIPRVHVIFTALERARGDEDTKVMVTDTALGGQQGRRYKADVSNVMHLESSKTPDGIRTFLVFDRTPTLAVKARRDDLLGRGRISADLGVIMQKLGYIGEDGRPIEGGDAGTAPSVEPTPDAEKVVLSGGKV